MSIHYPTWGMAWGVSWGESWGPIEVEEEITFGPWCVGGDDEKPAEPKHTYGQHPFFRPVDLPPAVAQEIEELVAEQTQVVAKKQQTATATDEYWALQAYEQMLRLEAERLAADAIAKARAIEELDIAFVMLMLEEA